MAEGFFIEVSTPLDPLCLVRQQDHLVQDVALHHAQRSLLWRGYSKTAVPKGGNVSHHIVLSVGRPVEKLQPKKSLDGFANYTFRNHSDILDILWIYFHGEMLPFL